MTFLSTYRGWLRLGMLGIFHVIHQTWLGKREVIGWGRGEDVWLY